MSELRKKSETFWMNDEKGGISFQGIVFIIIFIGIIWAALQMLPLIQVPSDLEGQIKDICKEYLRLHPREKNNNTKAATVKNIREAVATLLEEHTYKPKDLKIEFPNNLNMAVRLKYTLNVSVLGIKMDTDKDMNLKVESVHF